MKLLGYLNIFKEILKLYSPHSLLMKTDYLILFASSAENGTKGNISVADAIVTFSPSKGHDPAKA